MRPRRMNLPPACKREQQHPGPATCAGTSGKQHSTALLLPRTGIAPTVSCRFFPNMRRAGLLPSPTSYSAGQPWWLGYLDTGADDIVFPDAPKVTLYYG